MFAKDAMYIQRKEGSHFSDDALSGALKLENRLDPEDYGHIDDKNLMIWVTGMDISILVLRA